MLTEAKQNERKVRSMRSNMFQRAQVLYVLYVTAPVLHIVINEANAWCSHPNLSVVVFPMWRRGRQYITINARICQFLWHGAARNGIITQAIFDTDQPTQRKRFHVFGLIDKTNSERKFCSFCIDGNTH